MANQLGMAEQHTILVLARRGWSHWRIAPGTGHPSGDGLALHRTVSMRAGPSAPTI